MSVFSTIVLVSNIISQITICILGKVDSKVMVIRGLWVCGLEGQRAFGPLGLEALVAWRLWRSGGLEALEAWRLWRPEGFGGLQVWSLEV